MTNEAVSDIAGRCRPSCPGKPQWLPGQLNPQTERRPHLHSCKRANICLVGAIPPQVQAADGASAFSSACCCSLVRFVLSTVPPNLAISGSTRS